MLIFQTTTGESHPRSEHQAVSGERHSADSAFFVGKTAQSKTRPSFPPVQRHTHTLACSVPPTSDIRFIAGEGERLNFADLGEISQFAQLRSIHFPETNPAVNAATDQSATIAAQGQGSDNPGVPHRKDREDGSRFSTQGMRFVTAVG